MTTYVHVPYLKFFDYLETIIQDRVNIELYLTANDIDSNPEINLERINRILVDNGLICTVHGPFHDLSPGGLDQQIRKITYERFLTLFDLVAPLQPKVIVLHPGYDEIRYGDVKETWLENSKAFWEGIVEYATKFNLKIALENTFEKGTGEIKSLLQGLSSPSLGHCFDIGHFNIFVNGSFESWLKELGNYLFEVHLHDNHGEIDEHLALGNGNIDFQRFFSLLEGVKTKPALTIEAHTEEDARISIARINSYM
ncbi:MAG: sugar phosphate isomerase/epimerase [bacterium]